MNRIPLGRTGIAVSQICLGTMTWGSQNSEAQAHAQLDRAIAAGVNFIDTAEMYPATPRRKETTGATEAILGNWLAKRADRDRLVVATKCTGEGNGDIRGGARVTGATLREALEGSLKRLRNDHVDLYQLHWPNRDSYHFRQNWGFDPRAQAVGDMDGETQDMLGEVSRLIEEGKIRAFGLSNETAWGVMKFIQASERHGLPRIASVQNEYSLLCRLFDTDLAEISVHEEVLLMAFSPLAAGLLSGKYLSGEIPAGSRRSINDALNGRVTEQSLAATAEYVAAARRHGLDPAQMALAFTMARPFPVAPIIGATEMAQLETNLAAVSVELPAALVDEIAAIHRRYPMPM